jgi:hypothetical protein
MACEEAKKALGDFVDGFLLESEAARSFLGGANASGVDQASAKVGENVKENVIVIDPIFSTVTDPIQKALLEDRLVQTATESARRITVEDTANRVNRIFEESRAAALNLFSVGSDFFYDALSKNAQRLRRATAAAATAGAELQALAVAYNTFHQTVDRSDLDNLDENAVAQVRQDTMTALGTVELAIQEGETSNAIKGSSIEEAAAAMEALCTFFTNPTGIVGLLMMEKVLELLTNFETAVNTVIALKQEFENGFNNTLNANFVNPITRTLNTVTTELSDVNEKLTGILGKPTFDKFTALKVLADLCMRISTLSDLVRRNPDQAKVEISADVNFSTFDTATVAIAGETNGPATAYLEFVPKYRQTAQAIMVQDIRPALADRTTELVSKIASVQAWLVAQAAILTALPVIQSLLTTGLNALVGTAALQKVDGALKANDMSALAKMKGNNASKAGEAAEQIKGCLEDLPPSEADKFNALCEVRSILIGVEQTQALAAEAIINESPGAIGEVDGLTQIVKKVSEQGQALLV